MKNIFNLFVLFFCFQKHIGQNFDRKLVSNRPEINLAFEPKMRGIEIEKIIYYIETDLQTLSSYEKGKLKWKTNIIAVCGKPAVGKSEIRAIKLKGSKIFVVFGKHSFAEVDKKTGKTQFLGAD